MKINGYSVTAASLCRAQCFATLFAPYSARSFRTQWHSTFLGRKTSHTAHTREGAGSNGAFPAGWTNDLFTVD